MNPFEISTILARDVTPEHRKAALVSTAQLLHKIDIHGVEKMRQHFELPPEALGILTELYCMMLAYPQGVRRVPLPIGSSFDVVDGKQIPLTDIIGARVKVLPNVMHTIRATPREPFKPERLVIGNNGDGAKTLLVNDIRIDGKSQYSQKGDIPADMFLHDALNTFVSFTECKQLVEIDITYIGAKQDGVEVHGAFVGVTDGIPSELLIAGDRDDPDVDVKNTSR